MSKNKSIDLMERMGLIDNNVMKNYYDIVSNNGSPIKLNEETVDRVINKHGKNGFIIISAHREDIDNESNNTNTKSLIKDIRNSNFSYFPVYGGYRGTDSLVDKYEPSFVVVNYDREGKSSNFNDLKSFAIEMCAKYNQDSVLIKAPNQNPIYIGQNGEKVNSNESDKVVKNDLTKEFFTSLIKTKNIDNNNPSRAKRFTYDINFECYCNPMPTTLNECMRRKQGGEILPKEYGEK